MDRQSDPARGAGAVGLFYSDSEGEGQHAHSSPAFSFSVSLLSPSLIVPS